MKSKLDHLLACAGEECGEVQQVVGKALRFGIWDHHPDKKITNLEMLRREVHDLLAVYELICEELGESKSIDPALIRNKRQRVMHYMGYARDCGQLEQTP